MSVFELYHAANAQGKVRKIGQREMTQALPKLCY